MEDLVSLRCKACQTTASYGFPGHSPDFCARHKESGTIPHPRQRCKEDKCTNIALWGVTRARHCETHKIDGEMNLVHRTCVSCALPDLLQPDTGLCPDCDPAAMAAYRRGCKERMILHLFNREGVTGFVHDRPANGCGRERPDFRFDGPTHVTVVEVDEDQHRLYACERARMVNLCQASWKPHVFIRYNPDPYVTNGKTQDPGDSQRHKELLSVLATARALPPTEDRLDTLRTTRLFYDGHITGDPTIFTRVDVE